MIHYVTVHARSNRSKSVFLVVETQKDRACDLPIASLRVKSINRKQFQQIVDRYDGDAYDKSFESWDHLVALSYAQLSGIEGLRAFEAAFNANPQHHYHLGTGKLSRSTLADTNARRPVGIFAEVFARLVETADRRIPREGQEMVRLIDSSPIPLGKVFKWSKRNGRIRGMKMHVVYDPKADIPTCVEMTLTSMMSRSDATHRLSRIRLLRLRLVAKDQ